MRVSFRPFTALLLATLCALPACGDDDDAPPPDAGVPDLGGTDLGGTDLGSDLGTDLGADLGDCVDEDRDGVPSAACGGTDCDDADPGRYPGNTEVCDGDDEDCDDETLGPDADGDGDVYFACCDAAGRCGSDCDDTRRTINAAAIESCNGVDDDCDGQTDEGISAIACRDVDGDGRGPVDVTAVGCTVPIGATTTCNDCADGDSSRFVGASEDCNAIDDDCDGAIDEGCDCTTGAVRTCSRDAGACRAGTQACLGGVWESACTGGVFPSVEVCDMADNDCDGQTDEGVTYPYYPDCDRDGYGDSAREQRACLRPIGLVPSCPDGVWAMVGGDCDDRASAVYPGVAGCCAPPPVVVPTDMPCTTPGEDGSPTMACDACRSSALLGCTLRADEGCALAYAAYECCKAVDPATARVRCAGQFARFEMVCNTPELLAECAGSSTDCGTPACPPRLPTVIGGACSNESDGSDICLACKEASFYACGAALGTACAAAIRAYDCCADDCPARRLALDDADKCGSFDISTRCVRGDATACLP
jgi:hypothetical protein